MADGKAYRATVCFGSTSETDDRDGELVPGSGPAPTREAVEAALAAFRGRIQQRPPDYSALKVGGRRAYQLARQGTPADIPPRAVTISRQTGSGAHVVGEELAKHLQAHSPKDAPPWTLFDRNLVEKVLEEHHLPYEFRGRRLQSPACGHRCWAFWHRRTHDL